jgi:DNA polymerase-3 subunit epsilon
MENNMIKPLVFFDLETTGKNVKEDRIVEISLKKVDHHFQAIAEFTSRVNPGIPIPPEATAVHGISDEMVKNEPHLKDVIEKIGGILEGADVAGYNSNFYDVPLLYNELLRAGYTWDVSKVHFIDVCSIYKRKEDRTLSAAVKFYLSRDHENAHGAQSDRDATIEIFKAQLQQYPELSGMSREQLALYCNYDIPRADLSGCFTVDKDGDYVINFGKKCKGAKAKDNLNYVKWMMGENFMPDTKEICKKILGKYNVIC